MGGAVSITAVCTVMAVVGSVLLWLGLRGRRVGDHPFCRACKFDLFGLPHGSANCPECGRDVAAPRATIIGARQRRRRPMCAGVAMLVPSVALLGVVASGALSNVDWQSRKPTWWLIREADSTVAATRAAALKELLVRQTARRLADGDVDRLVARGMALQGDATRPWDAQWGRIIEQARDVQRVSDAQWTTYGRQSAEVDFLSLHVRPHVRRGDSLPHALRHNAPRTSGDPRWTRVGRVTAIVIDGDARPVKLALGPGMPLENALMPGMSERLDRLPVGPHKGELCIEMVVTPPIIPAATRGRPLFVTPDPFSGWWSGAEPVDDAAVQRLEATRVQLRLPFEFELLPPETPSITPVNDESFRQRVEASLQAGGVFAGGASTMIQITCNAPPIDLSFRVFVRSGANERDFGVVAFRRGQMTPVRLQRSGAPTRARSRLPLSPPRVDTFDLIFRPDPAAALRTVDMVTYWNHEVVVKDVPLQ